MPTEDSASEKKETAKEKKGVSEWVLIVVPSVIALIGVFVGDYLNFSNTEAAYKNKHLQELREESFIQLHGLEKSYLNNLFQLNTHILLSNYDKLFNDSIDENNVDFLKESNDNDMKTEEFQNQVLENRKTLNEVIGKIKISYIIDDNLKPLIDSLDKSHGFNLDEILESKYDGKKTISEDEMLEDAQMIKGFLESHIKVHFTNIYPKLMEQINEGKK
ncbi:MAG TPA: hypothetical protein VHP32_02015 [Ignavibacteria bacterium]|nr:hypothetical protein [Ignavibacteria bacterium]